jgi:CelD/BcsL family acetyltransferase involved in cellulose biosynthesis
MTASQRVTVPDTDTQTTNQWYAQTLRDDDSLTRLADEWEDLYRRCSSASAFMSSAWLQSSWRSYGRSRRLVLVLVRRDGQLVAATALTRRRRYGLPVLTPVGVGHSDFNDVLIDDSCATEAGRRLAQELAAQTRWHTIEFPEVRDGAAGWQMFGGWPFHTWRLPGSMCLELPARPIEELIKTLPGRAAQSRRRKRRKIDEAGIDARMVGADGAAETVAALLRLHHQQWRGRGMNPDHGRSRFAAHLAGAIPAMLERGQALLVEYRLDSELVAAELLLAGGGMICGYLYGFRPELRQRIDVTQLLLSNDLDLAQRLGLTTLNMLRGDEPYKREWRPREARNRQVLLAGPHYLPALAYAAGIRGRHRLAQLVKTRLPALGKAVRSVRRA